MQRLFIIILLLTTGCNSSLVQLQKIEPSGSDYQTYLAREYLDFAEAEADQYDWFDSAHFARKGLKLSKGKDAEAEILQHWDINADVLPTLIQARQYLVDTLNDSIKQSHPKEAAQAQFLFDCWVEQEEEIWQTSHIAYCREKFYSTLDKLYILSGNEANDMTMAKAIPEMNIPVEEPTAMNNEGSSDGNIKLSDYADHTGGDYACSENCSTKSEKRTLYFEFGSSNLTSRVKRVISNIVSQLKDVDNYEITLNGYTDRVGKEGYNMALSKERSSAVKKELVALGLNANAIIIYAFGETHGLLDTEDNVPEKENRAVEIIIEM